MSPATPSGEPVLDLLRRQIVDGRFPPGARLPNRTELIRRLGVCSSTLQKAQDVLKEEGFVEASRRRGTFVTTTPPHLFHVGVTFDLDAEAGEWAERSRFLLGLQREAEAISKLGPWRLIPFFNTSVSESTRAELAARVRERRLAGLIVTNPYGLGEIVASKAVPVVAFAGTGDPGTPLVLKLDPRRLIDRALDDLKSRGRTRVALLTSSSASLTKLDHLYRAAAARGMRAHEPWVQGVSLKEPHWARNAVRAMFAGRQDDRPDGLIVADEHLLDFALAGLLDQGLRLPRDVEVIAHANFHISPATKSPTRRLGYLTADLLMQALSLIDRSNREGKTRHTAVVDPSFEDELHPAAPDTGPARTEPLSGAHAGRGARMN